MFRSGTDKGKKVFKMMENSPIPSMLNSLGSAVVEAQFNMDMYVAEVLQIMADKEGHGVQIPGQLGKKSLLELGFVPSFYHFSEVNINIRLAISSMEGEEAGGGAEVSVGVPIPAGPAVAMVGASMNASYSNKYSFTAEAASEINTKIVSIPPPDILNEIILKYIEDSKET